METSAKSIAKLIDTAQVHYTMDPLHLPFMLKEYVQANCKTFMG